MRCVFLSIMLACALPLQADALSFNPDTIDGMEAVQLLAKLDYLKKNCGGKFDEAVTDKLLEAALRHNTMGMRAYYISELDKAAKEYGADRFCLALGRSIGADTSVLEEKMRTKGDGSKSPEP